WLSGSFEGTDRTGQPRRSVGRSIKILRKTMRNQVFLRWSLFPGQARRERPHHVPKAFPQLPVPAHAWQSHDGRGRDGPSSDGPLLPRLLRRERRPGLEVTSHERPPARPPQTRAAALLSGSHQDGLSAYQRTVFSIPSWRPTRGR